MWLQIIKMQQYASKEREKVCWPVNMDVNDVRQTEFILEPLNMIISLLFTLPLKPQS